MVELGQTSLGDLIELAVEAELVEFCYLAREVLVIAVGGHQLSFEPAEGGAFLRSLVQGWVQAPAERRGGRTSREARQPLTAAAPPPAAAPAEESQAPFGSGAGEGFLEAVLELAEGMGLIRGYEQDGPRRRVKLYTPMASAEMTSSEALEYLTESILHELCAAPAAPEPPPGPKGGPEEQPHQPSVLP